MRNDRSLGTTICGTTAALLLLSAAPTRAAAAEQDTAATFKRADVNEDGRLDGIELRDREWLALDKDGDGEITRAEFMARSASATTSPQQSGTANRPTTAQEWNRWGHAYLKRSEDAHAMWAFAMGMRSDPRYAPNVEAMSTYSERFAKVSPAEPPRGAPDPTQAAPPRPGSAVITSTPSIPPESDSSTPGSVSAGGASGAPPVGNYVCYYFGMNNPMTWSSLTQIDILPGSRMRIVGEIVPCSYDPAAKLLTLNGGKFSGATAHHTLSSGKSALVFKRKENEAKGHKIDISDTWCYWQGK